MQNKNLVKSFVGAIALGFILSSQGAFAAPKAKATKKPKPSEIAKMVVAPVVKIVPNLEDYYEYPSEDLLVINTSKGRIIVALATEFAPNHVSRIKELTREKFYDGIVFHRVIEGFMAQTGDPTGTGTGGSSKPDLVGEFTMRRDNSLEYKNAKESNGIITGWLGILPISTQSDALMERTNDGKVRLWPNHCAGVASMARAGDPNSANSQFFLMRDKTHSLDAKYSAWGYVVSGLEVVKSIRVVDPENTTPNSPSLDKMLSVRIMADLPKHEQVKVWVEKTNSKAFNDKLMNALSAKGDAFSNCDIVPNVQILNN